MPKEFYEIAYIIPFVSQVFPRIQTFVKTARSRFKTEELAEINVYSWTGGNSLGIILRFRFENFLPSMMQWFENWIMELRMQIIELEKFDLREREAVIKKFELTSDVRFIGNVDFDHVFAELGRRFSQAQGVRKEERVESRLKLKFKTAKELVQEYTENISFGGMFIRGQTELPLRSRLEVVLELPEAEGEVKAIAEVVHIVSEEKVALINGGRVPGCGVQFIQFIGDSEAKLQNYIGRQTAGSGLLPAPERGGE